MVDVYSYNPLWAARFERLRIEYTGAFAAAGVPLVAIEHVGSTAVPGLAAKPVIDVDLVVERDQVAAATAVLVGLGFTPRGELGIPDRWAFHEPERLNGTHTYLVVNGSLALKNHLALRRLLRASPAWCYEYGALKIRLAAEAVDAEAYAAGKNDLIQRMLAAAGLTRSELEEINDDNSPLRGDDLV